MPMLRRSSYKSAIEGSEYEPSMQNSPQYTKLVQETTLYNSLLQESKKGTNYSQNILNVLNSVAREYLLMGERLGKTVEKNLDSSENSSGDLSEFEKSILTSFRSFQEIAVSNTNFGHSMMKNIVQPMSLALNQIKKEVKDLEEKNAIDRKRLKQRQAETRHLKRKAIKEIEAGYKSQYFEAYDLGSRKSSFSLKKTFKNLSKTKTSNSENLREYNTTCCEYNNLSDTYYTKTIPKFQEKLRMSEEKRIANLKKSIVNITEIYEILNDNTDKSMNKFMRKFTEETENSIYVQISNTMERSMSVSRIRAMSRRVQPSMVIFAPIEDTFIDKRDEIIKLKKRDNDIFDIDLVELMTYEHNKGREIPRSIEKIGTYILNNGIDEKGIFRLSASVKEIVKFKNRFVSNDLFIILPNTDVHVCACYLKQFIKQLPTHVISINIKNQCLQTGMAFRNPPYDKAKHITTFNQSLKDLPDVNRKVLKYLVDLICEISAHSETNKMTIENMAIIFSPSIMPPIDGNLQDVSENLSYGKSFIEFILINAKEIKWGC